MLDYVKLGQQADKEQYKALIPEYREELYHLQRATLVARIPVIVVVEGWDASGKGDAIHSLNAHLDPRTIRVFPILAPRTLEMRRPWLWRFWRRIPARGRWVVFSGSWYRRVLVDRVQKNVRAPEWRRAYRDILDFERMLSDDGYVIVKFFLHISRREQKRRFKKLSKDPAHAWRVTTDDWDQSANYDEYLEATEEMLQETDSEWGPWTVIDATDRRHRRLHVYKTLISRIEDQMIRRNVELPPGSVEAKLRIRQLVDSWHLSTEPEEAPESEPVEDDKSANSSEKQPRGAILDEEPQVKKQASEAEADTEKGAPAGESEARQDA